MAPEVRPSKGLVDAGACGRRRAGIALASWPASRRRPGPIERPGIFRITPLRPVAELRLEALAASPPPEAGPFRPVDLVELTSLDPTIRLDIRYATADNFLSTPVYDGGAGLPPAARRRGARASAPRPGGRRATAS